MEIRIMKEAGYWEAIEGLSLSYNTSEVRAIRAAYRLCSKDGGHNKFLESIQVWIDITAPRYWWQQFDTYRIGVTKQSESTMHTLMREPLTDENFEGNISEIDGNILVILNDLIKMKDFAKTFGKVLRRPSLFPVPKFAMKIVAGEVADYAVMSQRTSVEKIINTGYNFKFEDLEEALRDLLL